MKYVLYPFLGIFVPLPLFSCTKLIINFSILLFAERSHFRLVFIFAVYEIAGRTFQSAVFFDLSVHTAEDTASVLHDLLKSRVCGNELCIPGPVKSMKCALLETVSNDSNIT